MSKVVKKVLVSIPEPLLKRIDSKAKAEHRSRSAVLCMRIDKALRQEGKKPRDEVAA